MRSMQQSVSERIYTFNNILPKCRQIKKMRHRGAKNSLIGELNGLFFN